MHHRFMVLLLLAFAAVPLALQAEAPALASALATHDSDAMPDDDTARDASQKRADTNCRPVSVAHCTVR